MTQQEATQILAGAKEQKTPPKVEYDFKGKLRYGLVDALYSGLCVAGVWLIWKYLFNNGDAPAIKLSQAMGSLILVSYLFGAIQRLIRYIVRNPDVPTEKQLMNWQLRELPEFVLRGAIFAVVTWIVNR